MSANRTNSDAATVQTVPWSTTPPTDGQVPVYNAAAGKILWSSAPPGTGDIRADGSVPFAADESMGGHKLTNVADATNPTDAVNLEVLQGNFDVVTATAGPAAASGTSHKGLRSDCTIPIAFGSDATGDIAVRGASNYNRLGIGTTGQALIVSGGTAAWGGVAAAGIASGAVTFAKLDNSAMTQIADPTAGATSAVIIDATAAPRPAYYMDPTSGSLTFDPTAATVSQVVTITMTTTSANKLTIKVGAGASVAGFTVFSEGTINTNYDFPGSAANSITGNHQWTLTIDVPNKIVYVSPPA